MRELDTVLIFKAILAGASLYLMTTFPSNRKVYAVLRLGYLPPIFGLLVLLGLFGKYTHEVTIILWVPLSILIGYFTMMLAILLVRRRESRVTPSEET